MRRLIMNKIPVPYRAILKRLNGVTLDGEIDVRQVRRLISITFRCSNSLVGKMMKEMSDMKLIEFKTHKIIQIKKIL